MLVLAYNYQEPRARMEVVITYHITLVMDVLRQPSSSNKLSGVTIY